MNAKTPTPAPVLSIITEVKYSLPDILKELDIERAASSFSMEKLDQLEIGKLFTSKSPRRAKSKK